MFALLACCVLVAADPADWEKEEAVHLKNIKPVTKDFVRAGEGYFSPTARRSSSRPRKRIAAIRFIRFSP